MDSQVRSILDFISATKRTFVIPVYQRNYSWDKENCEKLFDDLKESLEKGKKHYFGNIVYYAISTDFASGYSELALIDGQQRITTIMLLLAALRDLAEDETTKNNIQDTYLTNPHSVEQNRVKLKQIESDRDTYEAIIAGKYDGNSNSNAGANYKLFKRLIENSEKTVSEILAAINNLQVVALDLRLKEQGNLSESPQVIFESINATGKKLSDADLIRNWLLTDIPEDKQEDFYKSYWLKIEENAGSADGVVDFINRYLTMIISDPVKKGSEYRTFKKRIERMFGESENKSEAALINLCHFSTYYKWIKHPEVIQPKAPKVAEVFANLNEIGNEFAIPVLMFLAEKADNPDSDFDFDGLAKASNYLEDWLFRTRITRNITSGALSSILSGLDQLITRSTESEKYDETLYYELSNYRTADIWPNDEDFKQAFQHFDFYNNRFYKNYVHRKLEYLISNDRINYIPDSIEHIMPETLNDHWRAVLGDDYAQLHAEYLHTIGNLAPMNQSDNSANSNDPYVKKLPQFEASSWKLTRDVADNYKDWNVEQIKDRSAKLAELAANIWVAPLPRERQLEANIKGTASRIIDEKVLSSTFRILRTDNNGCLIVSYMRIEKNESGKTTYNVLPGSIVVPAINTKNADFADWFLQKREEFSNCLVTKDDKLCVDSKISFDSPSPAAGFCTGHSENGWSVWMDIDSNMSLDDLCKSRKNEAE